MNDSMIELRETFQAWLQQQVVNLDSYTPEPSQCRKTPIYYDDDDDEESSTPLRDIIISELPLCIAIMLALSTEEPKDSLIMGDEHLDTIPEKESDEFIKSSVENLVPNPSESEDTSGSDKLLSDEDIPKDNVKIYSNPLFEFNDEYISSDVNPLFDEVLENIESKDSYDSNIDEPDLLVTPLFDANEDECFNPGADIDEIDVFLDDDVSTDIKDDYHDSEGDIIYLESLLLNDTILNLPPKVFLDHDPRSFKDEPDNYDFKSFDSVWVATKCLKVVFKIVDLAKGYLMFIYLEGAEDKFPSNMVTTASQKLILLKFGTIDSNMVPNFYDKSLLSCDGLGGYDWSDQAEDDPTNFALMAYSSISSNFEVSTDSNCSSSCLENTKILKEQNEQLLKDLRTSKINAITYKIVLMVVSITCGQEMVNIFVSEEAYDKVFNHLDMLHAPFEFLKASLSFVCLLVCVYCFTSYQNLSVALHCYYCLVSITTVSHFYAALHGWYYMVFVTTVGEAYNRVFNHLDMLHAPFEGKIAGKYRFDDTKEQKNETKGTKFDIMELYKRWRILQDMLKKETRSTLKTS
nr:hypothetical protein [Tanacetum cinerariifolium]GEX64129.1 hypothetical protein [Tanacetum cinerariifolium]